MSRSHRLDRISCFSRFCVCLRRCPCLTAALHTGVPRYRHRAGANNWHMNVTTRSECSTTLRPATAKAMMTLVMVGGGVLCYPIHNITDVHTQQILANSVRGAERGDVMTVYPHCLPSARQYLPPRPPQAEQVAGGHNNTGASVIAGATRLDPTDARHVRLQQVVPQRIWHVH